MKLKELIKKNNLQLPSSEMILAGEEIAYTRKDGIHVVLIGCLRP